MTYSFQICFIALAGTLNVLLDLLQGNTHVLYMDPNGIFQTSAFYNTSLHIPCFIWPLTGSEINQKVLAEESSEESDCTSALKPRMFDQ